MRHEVVNLSDGWAGTNQTVSKIMQLVDDSLTDPLIVTTAQNVVRNVRERDRMAELRAISAFVRSRVRYTNESIETLKTPRLMIQEIQKYGKAVGDCDDSVILWMALLKSVGHRVRATVVSQRKDGLASHIYAEDFINGRWVSDDTIVKNKPLGWSVPAREKTTTRHYASAMGGVGMERVQSPFARFTMYGPPVRPQAVSDFLPRRRSFGLKQLCPRVTTKVGGMIEVNEWGMGEAIGFIPGTIGEVGKFSFKSLKKVAAKLLPKVVPFIAGGVVGAGLTAALKAKKEKKAAEAVPGSAPEPAPGMTMAAPGGIPSELITYGAIGVGVLILVMALRR